LLEDAFLILRVRKILSLIWFLLCNSSKLFAYFANPFLQSKKTACFFMISNVFSNPLGNKIEV